MVPWDYNCNYTNKVAAINLTCVGGMTHSGRCYSSTMIDKVTQEKLLVSTSKEQLPKEVEGGTTSRNVNKLVIKKEACEFLKFVKHSEYCIVKQLNKMPARISLLSLVYNSEPHHSALMKTFDEAYVAHNIFVHGVDQLIKNITVGTFIAFTD